MTKVLLFLIKSCCLVWWASKIEAFVGPAVMRKVIPVSSPSSAFVCYYSVGQEEEVQQFDVQNMRTTSTGSIEVNLRKEEEEEEEEEEDCSIPQHLQIMQSQEAETALMKLVPPPPSQLSPSTLQSQFTLELLHRLDAVLREWDTEEYLVRLAHKGNNSVRLINAGRFEVFVATDGKGSEAFDWVAAKVAATSSSANDSTTVTNIYNMVTATMVKQRILDFAKSQAKQADLSYRGNNYEFHNFALIINYVVCPQQIPHLDSIAPNSQFGLMITDQAPGTMWYTPKNDGGGTIQSAFDLRNAWHAQSLVAERNDDNDVDDDDWMKIMHEDATCRNLLRRYGTVLSTHFHKYEHTTVATGSLMALPVGVVHAGPSYDRFRAVLFFTGHPTTTCTAPEDENQQQQQQQQCKIVDNQSKPYNPDVQQFDSILLSDMITSVWTQLTVQDREFLLKRLVDYLARAPSNNRFMYKHLPQGAFMRDFAEFVETQVLVGVAGTSTQEEASGGGNYYEEMVTGPNGDKRLQRFLKEFARKELKPLR